MSALGQKQTCAARKPMSAKCQSSKRRQDSKRSRYAKRQSCGTKKTREAAPFSSLRRPLHIRRAQ